MKGFRVEESMIGVWKFRPKGHNEETHEVKWNMSDLIMGIWREF
jgi:hypothetical protein